MFADRIAFVDVETTGASPERARVTEVAIVRVTRDGADWVTDEWSSLVDPGQPIPAAIQALTGITPAMVAVAPSFAEIAPALRERLGDAVFVAHHARFDYGFLKQEFARAGIAFHARTLCTVRLSKLLDPDRAPHTLDALIARHGLPVGDRHRALGDARVLWAYVQAMYRRRGAQTVEPAIRLLLRQPSLPAHLPADTLDAIPHAPGVYAFYGYNEHPLYIGRSNDMRERVSSHFVADWRSGRGVRLASETRRIEWQETAGDLGARLLEIARIHADLPAHNIALRHKRAEVFLAPIRPHPSSLTSATRPVRLLPVQSIETTAIPGHYGPFASRSAARRLLTERAAATGLCLKALGLERGDIDAPCFNRQLGRCAGCCVGAEPLDAMLGRLADALADLCLPRWPAAGPIALIETATGRDLRHWHVFDHWCHLGTTNDCAGAQALAWEATRRFDPDIYRLLRSLRVGRDGFAPSPSPQYSVAQHPLRRSEPWP